MTVSSKFLFSFRPSSSDRSSDPDPASLETPPLRRDRPRLRHGHGHGHSHGHGSRYHHRLDSDAQRPSRLEHESARLERRSSDEFEASNRSSGVVACLVSRSKVIRNDRLPDAVVQARERLLERLRGLSLTESRQTSTVSGISLEQFVVSSCSNADGFRGLEVETPRHLLEANTPHTESTPDLSKKKPPRISWEALCSLQHQVCSSSEGSGDKGESAECYICLETFCEGDALIRLHCCHRFHPSCLEPWIQICGDCPCCRATVC
ncbi:putative E3 ubiquitin-protein ligase RHY1A [Iris pallida]|uniref:E3 ubiquitin-protein ligase RHY1A n=1 Tax=Iris pallida TaxID=29817 RepID=A0AAX6H454_IRIPA|nr:putative E3 ubiquitin-protein ligase RHY1A [Iris pallida]